MKKWRVTAALVLSVMLHLILFFFIALAVKSFVKSESYTDNIVRLFISDVKSDEPEKVQSEPPKRQEVPKRAAKPKKVEKPLEHVDKPLERVEDEISPEPPVEAAEAETAEKGDAVPDAAQELPSQGVDGGTGSGETAVAGADEGKAVRKTPYRASELGIVPKVISPAAPDYPPSLEEEGVEGEVRLELVISEKGSVIQAKVLKSDHELFSGSALEAVKKYRFTQGKLKDGTVVEAIIEFVVKFEISL
ncbi:TonB family protein [bacterium]|nr:TonB family protein [bacterium]